MYDGTGEEMCQIRRDFKGCKQSELHSELPGLAFSRSENKFGLFLIGWPRKF